MVVSPKEERGAGGILVARYLFIQARLSVDSRFFLGFSVTLSGSFFSFFFFSYMQICCFQVLPLASASSFPICRLIDGFMMKRDP